MTLWLLPALRGLAQRGGTTVMILAVALVATAAAATGPIYYQAAGTSILRDTLATAPVTGRGYEANETGAVAGLLGQLTSVQQGQLVSSLGSLAGRGLFAPPVYSVETALTFPQYTTSVPLVWRSAVCAHLRINGACPASQGQVIVSRDMAAVTGWRIGRQLRFPGYSALTITGLYRLPDQSLDYWFGRGTTYFPATAPIGVRTTIVLATAFALATFAVSAWSVGRDNRQRVASIEVGAPTVLTVGVPAGKDLSTIVAQADPGGRMAAAVDSYTSLSSGTAGLTTLGVDPSRFARVAAWQPGLSRQPLAALAARLDPRAPQPVILTGNAVRLTVEVHALSPPGALLAADVTTGSSPVSLGPLPAHGSATLTGQLVGCPCVLKDLDLSPPLRYLNNPARGSVTITRLQVQGRSGWVAAGPASVLSDAGHWRPGRADDPPDRIQAAEGALNWQFTGRPHQDAILTSVNRPEPLPAVVSAALVSPGQTLATGVGLDGSPLELRVISAAAAVPGAPGDGVIVDRRYAELAAGENLPLAAQQVWLADGALRIIEPRLEAAGMHILSSLSAAGAAATLARQGPALASALFLADAAAAALLAAGAAVLGLYLSTRRRRYDYAALSASGVPYPVLRRSLLTELGLVLGFGSVIGAGTGLLAAVVALRSVPEFLTPPPVPALSYVPSAVPLAVLLGMAAGLLIIAAVTASIMLIRGVSLDQLRETPA